MKTRLFSLLLFNFLASAICGDEKPASETATSPASPEVVKTDMEALSPGAPPDEMMVVDGEFEILTEGTNKVLQMKPEPLTEGTVLFGKSLKNGGTVKARIKGSSKKRSHPKFGIGIGGTSGYRVRLVGAEKLLEI